MGLDQFGTALGTAFIIIGCLTLGTYAYGVDHPSTFINVAFTINWCAFWLVLIIGIIFSLLIIYAKMTGAL